jgi:hypothetical protein
MLTIPGRVQRLCDGPHRRDFLRVGTLGALGLSLPTLLRASAKTERGPDHFGQARRCILLFLTGGAPQLDTFDPKPDAPAEYRGDLRPIATAVPGVQVSELFPNVSRHLDQCCLVRSVTHHDGIHTTAGYTMLTGMVHPQAGGRTAGEVKPGPHDHPHIGALLARAKASRDGIPSFASLPEVIRDAGVNTYPGLDGGLLGKQFAPFRIEANAERTSFEVPDALRNPGPAAQLDDRRGLLARVNRQLDRLDGQPLADYDAFQKKALGLMRSPALRRAFDLNQEPDRRREAYGRHLFGQGCLMARRLIEAGISLVSVYWHYEGPADSPVWDTHQNNFVHLRQRLAPPTDQAVGTLIADLRDRGLLDETLVICMGEFGRTPRVNKQAGRDHWAAVQSVLLAGGGIRPGSVYGASDKIAAFPSNQPVTPADLTATILHLLGIPDDLEIRDRTDRPIAACQGKPVVGILRGA